MSDITINNALWRFWSIFVCIRCRTMFHSNYSTAQVFDFCSAECEIAYEEE